MEAAALIVAALVADPTTESLLADLSPERQESLKHYWGLVIEAELQALFPPAPPTSAPVAPAPVAPIAPSPEVAAAPAVETAPAAATSAEGPDATAPVQPGAGS
ncbi:MAG TPA: hypothetical protein VGM18_04930 [Candidatus Sulfotelmatobacter sp.]